MQLQLLAPLAAALLSASALLAAEPTAAEINQALGLELFPAEGSLWTASASETAARLRWPEESRTSSSSSYRLYPRQALPVLDTGAYSMVLYGEEDRPCTVSFVFANKGDVAQMFRIDPDLPEHQKRRAAQNALKDYKKLIQADAKKIQEKLTTLLGEPSFDRVGDSKATSELVRRWDWLGHTFLLSAPREEYVALRILPTEVAESNGIERVPAAQLRQTLLERRQKRANGDMILSEIPMVDQGPKGYCVPATWERALRYFGIPADMVVLAMAGGTGVGGGTSIAAMMDGVNDLARRYGRRLRSESGVINERTVATYIDRGLPILWTMFSMDNVNAEINQRSRNRERITDWDAWKKELETVRRNAKKIRIDRSRGHVCMIIGYNKATGEVAVSDSWGPEFAERWMTFEEAQAVSAGEFVTIQL